MRPQFGIITPTYAGRETLLLRALESSKNQTNKNFVHVVSADGPAPGARELCSQYGATYTESAERSGSWGFGARNRGVAAANADFLLFLDDDNYLLEDCIEVLSQDLFAPIMIYKSLYFAKSVGRHVVLPPIPHVEMTKIDMGNFCVRSDVAKSVQFQPDYNQDFLYISECCRMVGWDTSYVNKDPNVVRWINKILMVYLFAPAGKSSEIEKNGEIW